MENGGQLRKRNDVGTTHIKENIVQIKQYPSPPTGDVMFRKKEKERARLALKIFRVSEWCSFYYYWICSL